MDKENIVKELNLYRESIVYLKRLLKDTEKVDVKSKKHVCPDFIFIDDDEKDIFIKTINSFISMREKKVNGYLKELDSINMKELNDFLNNPFASLRFVVGGKYRCVFDNEIYTLSSCDCCYSSCVLIDKYNRKIIVLLDDFNKLYRYEKG